MALVTYPSRAVPLLAPGFDRLPPRALEYLRLVGPAVLASIAASQIFLVPAASGIRLDVLDQHRVARRRRLRRDRRLAAQPAPRPDPRRAHRGRGARPGPGSPEAARVRAGPGQPSRTASASISTRSERSIERPDLDDRGGRADRTEALAERRQDGRAALHVGDEDPDPDHVGAGEAGVVERLLDDVEAARAWAPASPGWSERPSGPASVVPDTQQAWSTTSARL